MQRHFEGKWLKPKKGTEGRSLCQNHVYLVYLGVVKRGTSADEGSVTVALHCKKIFS